MTLTSISVFLFIQKPPLLPVEDDAFADSFESQTKQNYEDIAGGVPNLLSIDQLLESVCDLYYYLATTMELAVIDSAKFEF